MKGTLLLVCTSAALTAAVACAASGDNDGRPPPQPDPGVTVPPDSSTPDVAPPDASVENRIDCSDAGWCATTLPDSDLIFKDIWPFAGRAFAIAESPTLGIRILEWEDATAKWHYIDDNSQNASGLATWAGHIWAPNENELYFGVAPGTIFHGKRPAGPGTVWTWTHQDLPDHSPDVNPEHDHGHPNFPILEIGYPALGTWGTGSDVYAWYANTVFRWKADDAGAPTWVPEYIADDVDNPDEHLFFVSAAGTTPDDVWFVAVRDGAATGGGACPIIVRKTAAEGYRRIADGITEFGCDERPGFLWISGGKAARGWLTDLHALPGNRFVGRKGTGAIAEIMPEGDSYAVDYSIVPFEIMARDLHSLYAASDGQVWMSGWGLMVRGDDVWDGGTYKLSTLTLNGPINRPMYRVRGTSNTNLWAVGVRYALHKTTP